MLMSRRRRPRARVASPADKYPPRSLRVNAAATSTPVMREMYKRCPALLRNKLNIQVVPVSRA
jgi:hypothetical protein